MSTINDGGAAFPIPSYLDKPTENGERLIIIESNGMSLRDYFAAAALPALVKVACDCDHEAWDATVQHAYMVADAMLAERKKGQSE